jgi:hypothetical protein
MLSLRLCLTVPSRESEYVCDLNTTETDEARVVRASTIFIVCFLAAVSFEGCSPHAPQRAKDDADRKVIIGDWDGPDGLPPGNPALFL